MTLTKLKKSMSVILCIVLIAAIALFTSACGDVTPSNDGDTSTEPDSFAVEAQSSAESKLSFTLEVTDADGNTEKLSITTEEKTVGAALLKLGLIAGDDSQYGLYVKTVNGITADYDIDGTYWAFYVNGELAPKGVDLTDIVDGSTYAFKVDS